MEELCRGIHMPEEVTEILLRLHRDPAFSPEITGLTREETWETVLADLRKSLGQDPGGFKMLCCMLRCALEARETYRSLGLSDAIYYDTMGCFSRFVREHRESYGSYGFDRDFWTVRQVSCKLFRIGQLEYELVTREGRPCISLHIPTDVTLRLPLLRQSWEQAREILFRLFPEYENAPFYCHSWLLSPDLEALLPPESNILAFQRSFTVTAMDKPCTGVIQWVFKNPKLPPADYPENTSLQQKLKAFLRAGNLFRDARGILCADPFLTESYESQDADQTE